jgi:hypothetical protein
MVLDKRPSGMSELGLQRGITPERVRIGFEIDDPVELLEVAAAFGAFSRQYQKVLRQYPEAELHDEEVRLYLTKIETNCIMADLGGYAMAALPVVNAMDWHNIFVEFINRLNTYIRFFQGLTTGVGGKEPTKSDCEDFKDILEVVANKRKGSLSLSVNITPETSSLQYTYNEEETQTALEGVRKRIAESETITRAQHEKVLLWLPQLNFEEHKSGGRTSDKGLIESISSRQLPIFWLSELDSIRIKSQEGNPSKVSYIVDVNVETKQQIPRAYRVVRLHEIVQDDTTDELASA